MKLTKCEFLTSRIGILGHLVDGGGIHTVDSKITAVKNIPTPKSMENARSLLRLAGYFRAFVNNFAFNTSLLTHLLKKDVPFLWNGAQQQCFSTFKDVLTHAPILEFQDYLLPFTSCTEASALGIGAAFMQPEES